MILYLDTSAFVPLLVTEASSARCRQLWNSADLVLCTAIGHVEASAAFARTQRAGTLPRTAAADAIRLLDELWNEVAVIPADEPRLRAASAAALRHGLRGYDAVHCAAALTVAGDELVAGSGDRALLAAWRTDGLAVADTTLEPLEAIPRELLSARVRPDDAH